MSKIPQHMADAARALGRGSLGNTFFGATGTDLTEPENLYSAKTGATEEAKVVEQAQMGNESALLILGQRSNAVNGEQDFSRARRGETLNEFIERQRAFLDQRLALYRMELEELESLLEQKETRLAEIDKQLEKTNEALAYVDSGNYEVGNDGKIKNDKAEQALKDYEDRTGTTVDRSDSSAVYIALMQQKLWLTEQRQLTVEEIQEILKAREFKKTQITDIERRMGEVDRATTLKEKAEILQGASEEQTKQMKYENLHSSKDTDLAINTALTGSVEQAQKASSFVQGLSLDDDPQTTTPVNAPAPLTR